MIYKIQRMNNGFSLIEIVVALGVFAMLAATVSSTAGLGYLSEKQSSERVIAQSYAVEGIEAVKSIRQRGWSELIIGQHGLQKSGGYWEFNGSQDIISDYIRQIIIAEVYRDGNGDIVGGGGSLDQHTKLVTVEVMWQLSPGIYNSINIDNYFTNWQSQEWIQSNWFGGDAQGGWLDDSKYWSASDSIDTMNIGDVRLSSVGTLPSPYVLMMHLDSGRYTSNLIANASFATHIGETPDVDWANWEETKFGSATDSILGQDGDAAAQISYTFPLAVGNLKQSAIAVVPNTSYQLGFYSKGDLSYFEFILMDEDGYYLRSDGEFTQIENTIEVELVEDWNQYNISFTTRGDVEYLYLTFSGSPLDFNQWFAIDNVELSRSVVYDMTSYRNNGRLMPNDVNGPYYTSGQFDQGLVFDDNGDYVFIPASDSLNLTSGITLEAWIKPSSLSGDNHTIISKWNWTAGDYRSYRLFINSGDQLEFSVSSDGQDGNKHEYSVTSSKEIEKDVWQHVIGSYNGTDIRVYINGVLEDSESYNLGIYDSGDSADILIGAINDNLQTGFKFLGMIDEVSVQSVGIDETNALEHYVNSPLDPEEMVMWVEPDNLGVFMADKKVAGMHVSGNYLYLALLDKKRVEIFDLNTNPASPTSLGTFITTNKSEDVFTYGNYVYVMTDVNSPGIEIYEYDSNPVDAIFVSSLDLDDNPAGLWIDNDLLFISLVDNSVVVYDLSVDAENPLYVGDFATGQNTTDIAIYGEYAYVSMYNTTQALETFDISLDPTNPSSTDIRPAIEEPSGVTTRDSYLFLITQGASRKVLVFDIYEDPLAPAALGELNISDNGWDIATWGSYLYIGLGGSSKGVEVFDMTFMIAGGSGETNYETYGTLESSAFDVGDFAGFNFISWSETLPSAEEDIRVQIKTAETVDGLVIAEWTGPSGVGSYYESGLENIIPAATSHNGDRYIKYLIHLYGSGDDTPILGDIIINYTP